MKHCPRCRQVYNDDQLNFCLNDGELLSVYSAADHRSPVTEDSPPTLMMDHSRVTNPIGWQAGQPIEPFGSANRSINAPVYSSSHNQQKRDQTLPTVSLVLGIAACLLVCCSGGIWLGLPAAVVGFLGLRNTDSDPARYGGRGLAIAGMVLGIITFLASMFILIAGQFGRVT